MSKNETNGFNKLATIMAHAKFILDMTVQCNPILFHILVLSNDYLSIKEKVGLFE